MKGKSFQCRSVQGLAILTLTLCLLVSSLLLQLTMGQQVFEQMTLQHHRGLVYQSRWGLQGALACLDAQIIEFSPPELTALDLNVCQRQVDMTLNRLETVDGGWLIEVRQQHRVIKQIWQVHHTEQGFQWQKVAGTWHDFEAGGL